MKNFRISLLFFLFSGVANILIASPTSKEEALQKAQQFYAGNVKNGLRNAAELQLVYTDTGKDAQAPAGFFVFNAGYNEGFVIVSGDNIAKPILAYSDKGNFPKGEMPVNLRYWLDFYHKEMQAVIDNKVEKSVVKTTNQASLRSAHSAVEPLLGGIKWDQSSPYNMFCPLSDDSTQRTVVGCIATAMAQVMKYHEWPVKSNREFESYMYSFDDESGLVYVDTIYTNFGEITYRWDDMLDFYNSNSTPAQDSAVATLSYHCGLSVNMQYGTAAEGGSFASAVKVASAMVKHFGYDPDMRFLSRDYFDQSTWSKILMNELDAGRPVLYSGASRLGGHEFVCDGYDSEGLFHFNWGWSGNGNGYYVISVVDPHVNSYGGYVFSQDALIGIRKDDGIVNPAPSHEMYMYYTSLTCSKPGLKSVSNDIFNVNFGYKNNGWNTFSGNLGLAMYKDEMFLKCIFIKDSVLLFNDKGSWNEQIDSLSLAGFTDGDYRLYAVYQPNNSTSWFKFKEKTSLSNYVNVSINGDSATFSNPDQGPAFVQASDIVAKGDVYQFKPSSFSVSVKNNGFEFNSYMSLYICSTTDPTHNQYLGEVFALIGKDETKTLEFSGILTVDSGLYNAYVVYDSLCDYSTWDYKIVDVAGSTPMQFKVLYYPGPELRLNKRLAIVGGDSIYQNKEFGLEVEFTNLGSTYDNEVAIQLYPAEPGNQVGQTGVTSILVDSCSTKAYTLKGKFDVEPDYYRLCVFYNTKEGWWEKLMPTHPEQSVYTWNIRIKVLANPTGIDNVGTKSLRLGRNPVEESIEIITGENVLQAEIYDINGRNLGRFSYLKTLPASNLNKGVYILRVTTDRGVTNLRFVK